MNYRRIGCHARRLWSVVRHGTRNPSRKVIRRIHIDLARIREQIIAATTQQNPTMCSDDIQRFQRWKPNPSSAEESHFLVAEGADEMIRLAERMQHRFPELLPDLYQNASYRV